MSIPEEQVKCIAHRTIREADEDSDKMISFEEFKEVNLNCVCSLYPILTIHSTGSEEY